MTGFSIGGIASLGTGLSAFASAIPSSGQANMQIAVLELEREVKRRAPVDTGHLMGSYTSVVTSQGETVTGHVGTNVEYAIHQEYGTAHQAGTPHLRPALEARRTDLNRIIAADTLRDALGHI